MAKKTVSIEQYNELSEKYEELLALINEQEKAKEEERKQAQSKRNTRFNKAIGKSSNKNVTVMTKAAAEIADEERTKGGPARLDCIVPVYPDREQ